jgi:uncharacterized membrane protein
MITGPSLRPGSRSLAVRDDRGSVLMLGMGLVVVCLLAVVVLVDVASALAQRQRLQSVADATALAGAQAIDLESYYRDGAGPRTRLDPSAVSAAARRHLAGSGARRDIAGLVVEGVWSDGEQVTVELSTPLRLPFLSGMFMGQVVVRSQALLAYR